MFRVILALALLGTAMQLSACTGSLRLGSAVPSYSVPVAR
jgi:hypothetical protein